MLQLCYWQTLFIQYRLRPHTIYPYAVHVHYFVLVIILAHFPNDLPWGWYRYFLELHSTCKFSVLESCVANSIVIFEIYSGNITNQSERMWKAKVNT